MGMRREVCFDLSVLWNFQVGIHPTAAEELVTMRTPTRRVNYKGEVVKV